ncbi:uncharacterized protein LOC121733342 [Aricia agestis]|uniref:uncharacterized protein LOC121733342 n=1 Tax=Aricia agestis TaxID=91739 RepID=UPI001C2085C4|nr:uncharacterized protein LOC121733342 [Aricia agestis]
MTGKNNNNLGLKDDRPTEFLFDISKQVKQFYSIPVIFLTHKDYSDDVFNALCYLRTALQDGSKSDIIDNVVSFHLKWMNAVNEIEKYTKRINEISRSDILEAINYTIEALSSRCKHYKRYITKYCNTLTNEQQFHLSADYDVIDGMHNEVVQSLFSMLQCFSNYDSDDEFKVKVNDAINDLLDWLDSIYDSLSLLLCKYINGNMPNLNRDLTNTLQKIVSEFIEYRTPSTEKLLQDLKAKGKQVDCMILCTADYRLEICYIEENIKKLESRILEFESNPHAAAAVKEFQCKLKYLNETLQSIENLKNNNTFFHSDIKIHLQEVGGDVLCMCDDFFQLRIFNYELPFKQREELVTELCKVWNKAVLGGLGDKSFISILRADAVNEEYTDDLGTFYIDEYSRKIYKIPNDETLYQENEQGKLVALADDKDHVYYYDECGRYYIDRNTRLRVYKYYVTASEYMLGTSGKLLKLKEERDGVTYYYDHFGRYYINNDGKHIYRETDTTSEYENDGFGNLVRLRSHSDILDSCPLNINVTEDTKYLQESVGIALKRCIAEVVLHQPNDPIKYLAECLEKYKEDIERHEKESEEKRELEIAREVKSSESIEEESNIMEKLSYLNESENEGDLFDLNFAKYKTMMHE